MVKTLNSFIFWNLKQKSFLLAAKTWNRLLFTIFDEWIVCVARVCIVRFLLHSWINYMNRVRITQHFFYWIVNQLCESQFANRLWISYVNHNLQIGCVNWDLWIGYVNRDLWIVMWSPSIGSFFLPPLTFGISFRVHSLWLLAAHSSRHFPMVLKLSFPRPGSFLSDCATSGGGPPLPVSRPALFPEQSDALAPDSSRHAPHHS